MKLRTILLEIFDGVNKSLDQLGIIKNRGEYRFKSAGNDYLVMATKYRTSPSAVQFMSDFIHEEEATSIYISLKGPGSYSTTKLGNQEEVYTGMLACLKDAITIGKPDFLEFTGAEDGMDAVYYAMIRKFLSDKSNPNMCFMPIRCGHYICRAFIDKMPEDLKLQTAETIAKFAGEFKESLKQSKKNKLTTKMVEKAKQLVGTLVKTGNVVSLITHVGADGWDEVVPYAVLHNICNLHGETHNVYGERENIKLPLTKDQIIDPSELSSGFFAKTYAVIKNEISYLTSTEAVKKLKLILQQYAKNEPSDQSADSSDNPFDGNWDEDHQTINRSGDNPFDSASELVLPHDDYW